MHSLLTYFSALAPRLSTRSAGVGALGGSARLPFAVERAHGQKEEANPPHDLDLGAVFEGPHTPAKEDGPETRRRREQCAAGVACAVRRLP